MNNIFIDADFPTGAECEYHCCPSCHPAQIGEQTVYGCMHKAWPQNRAGDFVPIVQCAGKYKNCSLADSKHLNRYIGGKKKRRANLQKKLDEVCREISNAEDIKWEVRKCK